MQKVLVSVVIPTYNRAALIERAVQSVLAQSAQDGEHGVECIVADDGSTDGTPSAVLGIKDERVVYERLEANCGACAARNAGVARAAGEYIAFLDSDDEWHKDFVEKQLRFLEETAADVVLCRMECFDEGGKRLHSFPEANVKAGRMSYIDLLRRNSASTQVMFGKAECFKEVEFDETMPRLQDWDEVLRLAKKYNVQYQDQVLVTSYVQKDGITCRPERGVLAMEKIYAKHKEAIEGDKTAAVNFYRKWASFVRRSGGNPAQKYLMASRHGGGIKDYARYLCCKIKK